MHAHNNTIEEYLGLAKTVFVVPVYQRNYDWKDDNCKQLFYDIVNVIDSGKEHFLGTICYKNTNSREKSIIDGQQRLTSITLLLKAMYDYDSNEDNREEIRDQYLYNKGRGIDSDFLRYKLHLNKRDDIVYHILLENEITKVEERLTLIQKKSRVYQNYTLFYELLSKYVKKGGSVGDILEALRSLTIIELEIEEENPQEIFESLNSTGLDLTNVDLLRNYFLMQFDHDTQTMLYNDYWSQIEDAIGVDQMEQFFVDYLVFKKRSDAIMINGRRNHITEKKLYISFKDYYASLPYDSDFEKTNSCFKDLKDYAEIYKDFIFSDNVNIEELSPIRRKLYFLISVNESSNARSLLLYIFNLYNSKLINDEMLKIAVDGVSSLIFRAKFCKAKGINRQFASSVMQRLDEITDYGEFEIYFWQAITSGKGSYAFPSDEEFKDALVNKDLYQTLKSKKTKYLFYTMEAHSPYPKGLPSFNDETLSVEHIMPRTLTTHWKNYLTRQTLENYDTSLHRLGNLTLTNYNGEMSNKSFEEKKEIYKESNYYYTRQIMEYDEWQIEQINERSKKIASEALKIWRLPEQYQNVKAVSKSLHSLDEETSQFAFTKPDMFFIGNNEYPVKNWSDVLPLLCKVLDEDNHEVFSTIANPEKISDFRIEDEKKKYSDNSSFTHISKNKYIRTVKSAANTLETAYKISTTYDALAETDFTSDILFRLK